MRIRRTIETTASPEAVHAYLSDFTNTNEWDPGTIETVRVTGDGGVGTIYDNVSEFNGRRSQLRYEVVALEPGRRIELHGEGRSATSVDLMELEPTTGGTRLTYTADIRLKGILRLAEPFIRGAFTKLGDEAERGLREALARL